MPFSRICVVDLWVHIMGSKIETQWDVPTCRFVVLWWRSTWGRRQVADKQMGKLMWRGPLVASHSACSSQTLSWIIIHRHCSQHGLNSHQVFWDKHQKSNFKLIKQKIKRDRCHWLWKHLPCLRLSALSIGEREINKANEIPLLGLPLLCLIKLDPKSCC